VTALNAPNAAEILDFAAMATHTYGEWTFPYDGLPQGDRDKYVQEINTGQWNRLESEDRPSGFHAELFSNASGEYTVAIRGIDGITDWQDWYYGNSVFVGAGSQQLWDALTYVWELAEDPQINPSQITFVGHSLGGGLSALLAQIFGGSAYVFAPAPFSRPDFVAQYYNQDLLLWTSNGLLLDLIDRAETDASQTQVTTKAADGTVRPMTLLEYLTDLRDYLLTNYSGDPESVGEENILVQQQVDDRAQIVETTIEGEALDSWFPDNRTDESHPIDLGDNSFPDFGIDAHSMALHLLAIQSVAWNKPLSDLAEIPKFLELFTDETISGVQHPNEGQPTDFFILAGLMAQSEEEYGSFYEGLSVLLSASLDESYSDTFVEAALRKAWSLADPNSTDTDVEPVVVEANGVLAAKLFGAGQQGDPDPYLALTSSLDDVEAMFGSISVQRQAARRRGPARV
jgi:hypothetical protein